MASLVPHIPLELMRAEKKFAVIEYIRSLKLHSRTARTMLQDWGVAVDLELNGTDYELVTIEETL